MKKRKILGAALVCLAVAAAIAGYSFGMIYKDKDAEILSGMVETDNPDNWLVVDSTALYAVRTLPEMTERSVNIAIAEVVEIGETTVKYPGLEDMGSFLLLKGV